MMIIGNGIFSQPFNVGTNFELATGQQPEQQINHIFTTFQDNENYIGIGPTQGGIGKNFILVTTFQSATNLVFKVRCFVS